MAKKKLNKQSQLSGGTLSKYDFKPMSPAKYSRLNESYIKKTSTQFKDSDKASFRSSKKMGKILLG